MTNTTHNQFPPGWDEKRVRGVLEHYETQSDEAAAEEDEQAFADATTMVVPAPLVPEVRKLISRHEAKLKAS